MFLLFERWLWQHFVGHSPKASCDPMWVWYGSPNTTWDVGFGETCHAVPSQRPEFCTRISNVPLTRFPAGPVGKCVLFLDLNKLLISFSILYVFCPKMLPFNISFSSYKQPIWISNFYNVIFVYLLFDFFYKVRCF